LNRLAYSASLLHYISSNYAVFLNLRRYRSPSYFSDFSHIEYLLSKVSSILLTKNYAISVTKVNYYAFTFLNSYSKLHCSYFNNCYFVTLCVVVPQWLFHILIQLTCFGIIVSSSALVCKPLTAQCTTICGERTKR